MLEGDSLTKARIGTYVRARNDSASEAGKRDILGHSR